MSARTTDTMVSLAPRGAVEQAKVVTVKLGDAPVGQGDEVHASIAEKGHDPPQRLSLQRPVCLGLAANPLLNKASPDLGGEPADRTGEECFRRDEGVEHGEEVGDVRRR